MEKGFHSVALKKVPVISKTIATKIPRKTVYFPETIYARLQRGWSVDSALDYPVIAAEVQR